MSGPRPRPPLVSSFKAEALRPEIVTRSLEVEFERAWGGLGLDLFVEKMGENFCILGKFCLTQIHYHHSAGRLWKRCQTMAMGVGIRSWEVDTEL